MHHISCLAAGTRHRQLKAGLPSHRHLADNSIIRAVSPCALISGARQQVAGSRVGEACRSGSAALMGGAVQGVVGASISGAAGKGLLPHGLSYLGSGGCPECESALGRVC
jgi:hypothetical protein